MKKYLVIYHSPGEMMQEMAKATPEQKEAGMKAWMDWKDSVGEDRILDFGAPLMPGHTLKPGGGTGMSSKEATGYSILAAESIEEAKSMLVGHPHLQWAEGCDIDVHEMISMG